MSLTTLRQVLRCSNRWLLLKRKTDKKNAWVNIELCFAKIDIKKMVHKGYIFYSALSLTPRRGISVFLYEYLCEIEAIFENSIDLSMKGSYGVREENWEHKNLLTLSPKANIFFHKNKGITVSVKVLKNHRFSIAVIYVKHIVVRET